MKSKLSHFTVQFFVFFFSCSGFSQSQCLFLFDKSLYERTSQPAAGTLVPQQSYEKINSFLDGVYNFTLLADGTLQVAQKFQSSPLKSDQSLVTHKSLFNGYLKIAKAQNWEPQKVIAAGKIILINNQVSQISNINFEFKNLNPKTFLNLISELKKQGVFIGPLTQIKIYSEESLQNSRFKEISQIRELQRAQVMAEKNQNPELALLWMNAKQFYRQLYILFPSQKSAGILDLIKIQKELGRLAKNSPVKDSYLPTIRFLKRIETEGILLAVHNDYKKLNSNSVTEFRSSTQKFLQLVEAYKAHLIQNPQMRMDL